MIKPTKASNKIQKYNGMDGMAATLSKMEEIRIGSRE
jgi:hypothetical protein